MKTRNDDRIRSLGDLLHEKSRVKKRLRQEEQRLEEKVREIPSALMHGVIKALFPSRLQDSCASFLSDLASRAFHKTFINKKCSEGGTSSNTLLWQILMLVANWLTHRPRREKK